MIKNQTTKLERKKLSPEVWEWQKAQIKANLRNPLYMELAIDSIGSAIAEKVDSSEKAIELKKTA